LGRILGIDYGLKRTGLAVTDPLRIIASALDVVETARLLAYLKNYFDKEKVDEVVVGMPVRLDNSDSDTAVFVRKFMDEFKKLFPAMPIFTADERFTTSIAKKAMIEGGMKKKERQVKGNADKISATLILQNYMETKK
jgi:putative Holliday junction resolvase